MKIEQKSEILNNLTLNTRKKKSIKNLIAKRLFNSKLNLKRKTFS